MKPQGHPLYQETEIYVIHALRGYEMQEAFMRENLSKYHFDFTFVTEGDPSLMDNEMLNQYFTKKMIEKHSVGKLSCTLNHILAYQRLIDSNSNYAIVLENDACFLPNFMEHLNKIYSEIDDLKKGFIISLENTTLRFPSYFQVKKNKALYQASAGRMAGAYLIDKKGATKAMAFLRTEKCDNIVDWWHNRLIDAGVLDMYWAHPPLVEQGSHNGKMSGAISSKKKSIIRRISWNAMKAYKTFVLRFRNEKRIIE